MNLRAGTYVVAAVTANGLPRPLPKSVQVQDGSYTQITLQVDTGIR